MRFAPAIRDRLHALALLLMLAAPLAPLNLHAQEELEGDGAESSEVTPSGPITLQEVEIGADGDTPRVCARFDRPLIEAAGQDYSPYVSVANAPSGLTLRPTVRHLCLDGLDFGGSYTLTLRQGLPALDGTTLPASLDQPLVLSDRNPLIRFGADGSVLPAAGRRALPVESVNLEQANVAIYRLNDRNLLNFLGDATNGRTLDTYTANRLEYDAGELLWRGTVTLTPGEKNRTSTTAIEISEILGSDLKPGFYAVSAEGVWKNRQGYEQKTQAGQWFSISDVGLTSWRSEAGLTVLARSIETGAPLSGVSLQMVAANNAVLQSVETDAQGFARFEAGWVRGSGGNRPRAIYAQRGEDFSSLDLEQTAVDLSDHGVSGRAAPGKLDGYLYTERGIYRTGEPVLLTALLRDQTAKAVAGVPLTLKAERPDGVVSETIVAQDQGDGSYSWRYELADNAFPGLWTMTAHATADGPPIGSVTFLVEDFVPPKLEVAATLQPGSVAPGGTVTLDVKADYYYGAPGSNLNGEVRLRIERDDEPVAALKGYSFGLQPTAELADAGAASLPSIRMKTDARGQASVQIPVSLPLTPTAPVKLVATSAVFDVDGRPVTAEAEAKIAAFVTLIGVKPEFEYSVPFGQDAAFSVATFSAEGQPKPGTRLDWVLNRIESDWVYVERGGSGYWQTTQLRQQMASGQVTSGSDGMARLQQPVDWGDYELVLRDAAAGSATAYRFYAGWASGGAADSPDKVKVDILSSQGNQLRVRLTPPFAGPITVMLADREIRSVQNVEGSIEGVELDLDLSVATRPGTYVLATAHMAGRPEGLRVPRRAMGAAWAPLGVTESTLTVTATVPEVIRPRAPMQVALKAEGAAGRPVRVTVAAVDEGVLRLTRYNRPRPEEHFLVQRQLELMVHDLYGRLIDAGTAPAGTLRQGGDGGLADNLGGLTVRSSRVTALYSGIVALDADGTGTVTLDVPDFNGRLRVMAVAWTDEAMGSARADVTVRDPVVADLTLPRFLAPGDRAQGFVSLRGVEGDATITASLSASGPITLAGETAISATLTGNQTQLFPVSLVAGQPGIASFSLTVEGAGAPIARTWDLEIRPANPYVTERQVARLAPGAQISLDPALLNGFTGDKTRITVEISSIPVLDKHGLMDALDLYPYGCTEQTVSVAMPLLYYSELAGADRRIDSLTLNSRLDAAIRRVGQRQGWSGLFGLWTPDDFGEPWLSAYVMDFLLRAKDQGFAVPQAALERGVNGLTSSFRSRLGRQEPFVADAYAALVLARAGALDLADLRYFAEVGGPNLPTPLARAQVAAALAIAGDREAGRALLTGTLQAYQAADLSSLRRVVSLNPDDRMRSWDYGSVLRDMAAVVALSLEHDLASLEEILPVAVRLQDRLKRQSWFSTQEQIWLILAARELEKRAAPVSLTVGGQLVTVAAGEVWRETRGADEAALQITNAGDEAYQSISIRGIARQPLPPVSRGFELNREILQMDGTPLSGPIRQGDLLVVRITGQVKEDQSADPLVVDLLPAGLEPSGITVMGGGEIPSDLRWLTRDRPLSPVRLAVLRDDRFVAALQSTAYDNLPVWPGIHLAYVVRAVTPGSYIHPGLMAEDMYVPTINARTASGRLTVLPAGE